MFDVAPALLLQLHDADDAGGNNRRLRNQLDVPIFRLAHSLLGVAAALKEISGWLMASTSMPGFTGDVSSRNM